MEGLTCSCNDHKYICHENKAKIPNKHNEHIATKRNHVRLLFRLLAARSGAGVAGSELLQRREWPRGVVLGLSRERGHGAALAAAGGAAPIVGEAQQQLQAVQRTAKRAVRVGQLMCSDPDPTLCSDRVRTLPNTVRTWADHERIKVRK